MASNSPLTSLSPLRAPLMVIAFLIIGMPAHSGAAPATPVPRAQRHEYRHEIDSAEESWRTAILKSNSSALELLLSDDYTGITANGAIQTKEQAVNSLKTGSLQVTALTFNDRKVRVYGSTAVVTSSAELTGGKNDHEVTGRYRYTRVYVRNQAGQWKVVSFEASRIKDSNEKK